MNRRLMTIVVLAALSCSFFAGRMVSQGKDDEKKDDMAAFQMYMTPGKEHQMLQKRAGTWDYKARTYMPGKPPTETKGKSERKMVLGGRFLNDETSGEAMPGFGDQPFQGMGVTGFDNYKKKYVSGWIDNMGTGIMMSEGVASADGKEIVYTSEEPDLMGTSGKMRKIRSVEKFISDDRMAFEMYGPGPDGKEVKTFEIEYTRKK